MELLESISDYLRGRTSYYICIVDYADVDFVNNKRIYIYKMTLYVNIEKFCAYEKITEFFCLFKFNSLPLQTEHIF